MPEPEFDPAKAVTFDLQSGLIHFGGTGPHVLVPGEDLAPLCAAAGPQFTTAFGRSIGRAMGQRIAGRIRGRGSSEGTEAIRQAEIGTVVNQLNAEFGLLGLGGLSLERWGRALVLVVERSPVLGTGGESLLEAVLEGAIEAAAGRQVRAVKLEKGTTGAKFFIGNRAAADKLREWLGQGVSWAEAVSKLHAPEANAKAARGAT